MISYSKNIPDWLIPLVFKISGKLMYYSRNLADEGDDEIETSECFLQTCVMTIYFHLVFVSMYPTV